MVLGDWYFLTKRIPGSFNVTNPKDAVKILNPEDEIVVYCSNEYCVASKIANRILVKNGFKNVKRYRGGIVDWDEAGFTLEGAVVYS